MAGAYAQWNYVLTGMDGVAVGEVLDATERTLTRALSAPATAGFKILVTNALIDDVLQTPLNLKVYRNDVLQFHGPVLTAQLAVDDPTATPSVAVTAADPAYRFEKRVVGQSTTGHVFGGTDRLTIAESLITEANNWNFTYGQTGVRTLGLTCGSTSVYIAGPYKKLSECIADQSNTLSGFDWYIDPIERISDGVDLSPVGIIGNFQAAAILGTTQAGAVFEYQGRANMKAPNFIRGIDTMVNHVISIPDDGPLSNLGVKERSDTTSLDTYGLYEEVVDTNNVTNLTLRNSIMDDHILYRKDPRQILQFQPDFNDYSGRVPEWGSEYFLGDLVRARVNYNDATLVDGFVRLYKMQFDIDVNNRETLTPTLVQES